MKPMTKTNETKKKMTTWILKTLGINEVNLILPFTDCFLVLFVQYFQILQPQKMNIHTLLLKLNIKTLKDLLHFPTQ